jgi:hypothetical protein
MGRQAKRTDPFPEHDEAQAIMEGCLAANRIERSNRRLDHKTARAGERELTDFMKRQPKHVRLTLLLAQYELLMASPAKANGHLSVAYAVEKDAPALMQLATAVV